MILPILLALVVTACAQSPGSSIDRETQYIQGKEYTYEYNGQILSGLPKVSKEFAGLKIKCNVKLQVQDEFRMELRDVQLCKIQKELDSPTEQQLVLPEDCEDDTWTNEIKEQLQKRIEFQWTKGQISEIRTMQSDPDWSVNIKRGVLELFQVNLEGDVKYYRIMEEGVAGLCESVYNVKAPITPPELTGNEFITHDSIIVNKDKNYEKCEDRPTRQQSSIITGELADDCREDQLLNQMSHMRYNITGNRKLFIIDSVIAEEKHIFEPFGKKQGQAISFVGQNMTRTRTRDIPDLEIIPRLDDTDWKNQIDGLKFVFPRKIQSPSNENVNTYSVDCQQMSTAHSLHAQIEQLLNNIVNGIDEYVSEESVRQLHLLREIMMGLNSTELCHCMHDFGQEIVNEAELNKKRRMIIEDLLPFLGSQHSVEVLCRRIESGRIEGSHAHKLVSLLSFQPNPDYQIADTILDLCRSPALNEDLHLKKICWLAFGSVVHKTCKDENRERCPESKQDRYMRALIAGIDRSRPVTERRMCLKAIGNAGIVLKNDQHDLLEMVKQIVLSEKDSETSPEIKAQAIYALRRITKKMSEEVRTILAPIYRDRSINHEVRIAAFVVIMDSRPDHLTIQMLGQVLQTETSNQVGNFVYSHLKTIAEAKVTKNQRVTDGAKEALKIAKKFAGGMQYSKSYQWGTSIWNQKVSTVANTNWLSTPDSVLGIGGTAKFNTKMVGHNFNFLEVGYHSEHLEELAKQLAFKVNGVYPPINEQLLYPILKGESGKLRDVITRMDAEVNVTERHPNTQPISGAIYLKTFGQEIHHFHFDKVFLEDLLAGRNQDLGDLEVKLSENRQQINYQNVLTTGDGWKIWPTMLGIPLSLNMTNTGIVSIQATGKAEMQPTLQHVLLNAATKAKKIEISGVFNPKLAMMSVGKLGVSLNHNLKAGIALESLTNMSAYINGSVKLDVETLKLESSVQLPQHNHTIMSVKTKPYTFIIKEEEMPKTMLHTSTPQHTERASRQGGKRFINSKKPEEMKGRIGNKSVIVEVSAHVPLTYCHQKPTQCLIAGPMDIDLKLLPGSNRSEELIITGRIRDLQLNLSAYEQLVNRSSRFQHIPPHSQSSSMSGSTSFTSVEGFENVILPKNKNFRTKKTFELPTALPESLEERHSKEKFEWENAYWTEEDQDLNRINDIDTTVQSQEKEKCMSDIPVKRISLNITASNVAELISDLTIDTTDNTYKAFTFNLINDIKYTPIEEQKIQEYEQLRNDPMNRNSVEDYQYKLEDLKNQTAQLYLKKDKNRVVVCVQGAMDMPETKFKDQSLDNLLPPHLADDMQVKYKLGLQYGKTCEGDKKVHILARATKSIAQRFSEAQSTSGHLSANERQCQQDREDGEKYSWACKQVSEERSQLRSLHVDATSKIGQFAEQVVERVGTTAMGMLSKVGEITEVATVNEQYNTKASIDIDADNFNISIVAPLRNITAKRCQLPTEAIKLPPFYSTKTPVSKALLTQVFNAPKPRCKVNSLNKIITFDNVTYDYELSKCHHILAKDCSPDKLFLVLSRKQEQGRPEKETVIYLAGHKIEFIPDGDDLRVVVDGVTKPMEPMDKLTMKRNGRMEIENVQSCKRQTLMDIIRPNIEEDKIRSSEVYTILTHKARHMPEGQDNGRHSSDSVSHRKISASHSVESISWSIDSTSSEEVTMKNPERKTWQIIKDEIRTNFDDEQISKDRYQVDSDPLSPPLLTILRTTKSVILYNLRLGLLVSSCGQNVKVEVSRYFQDMVCGLCGRFNGEVKDEFQGPSKEIYKQPKQFALSYQLQSVPEMCAEECVPRMTIQTKDVHINNEDSICYSKVLVPQCKQTCTATETKHVKTDFECIPRGTGSIDRLTKLIQQHRYNEVIHSLPDKATSFVKEIEIHTRCQQ